MCAVNAVIAQDPGHLYTKQHYMREFRGICLTPMWEKFVSTVSNRVIKFKSAICFLGKID